MRIPLLTAIGSLALALVIAGASSAQMYQGGYLDGFQSGSNPNPAFYSGGPYGSPSSSTQRYQDNYRNGYRNSIPNSTFTSGGLHGPPPAPRYPQIPNFSPVSKPMAPVEPSIPNPFAPVGPGVTAHSGTDVLDTTFDIGGDCGMGQPRRVQWMVSADAFFMTRVPGNTYALLKVPSPTPPVPFTFEDVALDVADFDFKYEPGWRITATRMVSDGWGIEAGYFAMVDGWNYEHTMSGILELQGPGWQVGSDPNLLPAPTETRFRVINTSEFYSGELNVIRGICDWATLRFGIRYIEFNDRLEVDELHIPLYNLLIMQPQITV